MATLFVYIESAADTPLTGASPVIDYWNKASPGAPLAIGAALTELIGGIGGVYFIDITTADGLEYAGMIDATAGAAPGTRYRLVTFSGTTDARIEVDIPILTTRLSAARAGNLDYITSTRLAELDPANLPADVAAIASTGSTGPWTTGMTTTQNTMLEKLWRIHGLDPAKPMVSDQAVPTGSRKVPADGSDIEQTLSTTGTVTTVTTS
jgi:hypothetical protein